MRHNQRDLSTGDPVHDDDGTLPQYLVEQIDRTRDDFEAAWSEGRRPRIENFLSETVEPARSVLLRALIVTERDLRQGGAESPTIDEYLARFPGETEIVHSAFGDATNHRGARPDTVILSTWADASTAGALSLTTTAPRAGSDENAKLTEQPWPNRIGKYQPTRLLGQGGFGRVYYAWHDDLKRAVAIKVTHRGMLGSLEREEMLLDEARLAASLKHPGIVTVYDVGRLDEGEPFVVLEYIEGQSLGRLLHADRLSTEQLVWLLVRVAEAAHYAHRAGLVHRDLTPANILIDSNGEPHVTDFGLAVNEDLQRLRSGEVAGTPTFMAPEQVRGETHRLDGRTDIWALGVTLYLGLTGRPPFTGRNRQDVYDEILHRDPKPPRQLDEHVPRELQRICLTCLAKRMGDRYSSAVDLAHDLQAWLDTNQAMAPASSHGASSTHVDTSSLAELQVVPKGLRAFDQGDAGFFLRLLPGPVNREGLPESVRFWKSRIEDCEGDTAFSVGLLYGPSGGGKSSLVKAGLLPRLDAFVRVVYVEASPGRTESQLLAALKRRFTSLPEEAGLTQALAAIREDALLPPGGKLLIVLDQFEQWLHAHPNNAEAELIQALRQCDGRHLQTLLLVRDDFWLTVTRLFRALEVPLVEGGNSAPIEMFDSAHARKVLVEFGRACGRIGNSPGGSEALVDRFLDQAIREMTTPDGLVAPVRLSLFAEMVRRRSWAPDTLRELGGVEGIGVRFLEETFDSSSAPPVCRFHRKAAQAVLQALLPAPTSVLRGTLRSSQELRVASGYREQAAEFAELMRILDSELRMVTAVDSEGTAREHGDPQLDNGEVYYQLAHDFLVGSIRQWLERKQHATRAGRARFRLTTITAAWIDRPSPQRLPSLLEWFGILWHTRPWTWSTDERRMLGSAMWYYSFRAAMVFTMFAIVALTVRSVVEAERSIGVLKRALKADYQSLASLYPELDLYFTRIRADLEQLENDVAATSRERAIATLLLHRDQPTHTRAEALRAWLTDANPDEVVLIRDALIPHPAEAGLDTLRQRVLDDSTPSAVRLRAACVLTGLEDVDVKTWAPAAVPLAQALLAEDRRTVSRWLNLLGPAVPVLVPPLSQICSDRDRESATRTGAAEAVAEALTKRGDSEGLARVLIDARPDAFMILIRELERLQRQGPAVNYLRAQLTETSGGHQETTLINRQAAAAVALATLGESEDLQPILKHRPDPRLRTQTIQMIAAVGLAPRVLYEQFDWSVLDEGERQAILLAWAETPNSGLWESIRTDVLKSAHELYEDDPDPGVHSAAELLIRRWDPDRTLEVPAKPRWPGEFRTSGGRTWMAGPNGHTLVVLPGPHRFLMGSPEDEPERFHYETRHYQRVERSLAVATKEVTTEQYQVFKRDYKTDARYIKQAGCPAGSISWYDAMSYCNWLSMKAEIPREQWCYPEVIKPGMTLPADAFTRTGFRLPTEAEWEFFCRAGTESRRSFGDSEEFLSRHAWTILNSHERAAPAGSLLPNPFGLFDTLGSVWEWCHDGPSGADYYPLYPSGTKDHPAPDTFHGVPVNSEDWRIIRGGAFDTGPSMARSAHRDIFRANNGRYFNGLRVVRTLATTQGHP